MLKRTVLIVLLSIIGIGRAKPFDMLGLYVKTQQGTYKGATLDGGRQWLGIRYAAPSTGELHFSPTQPPSDLTNVRDATQFGSACIQAQTAYAFHQGTEDCLFLNIYAPDNSTASSELPVMIWIHGGGFINGAGSDFISTNLSRTANAVVVTLNYRLGPFGWLALDSLSEEQDGASGNYGLMDQRAVFQWVKNNIANFGGNPNLVTIFGQSAGGESVLSHVAAAPGDLFQRAISHSAPAGSNLTGNAKHHFQAKPRCLRDRRRLWQRHWSGPGRVFVGPACRTSSVSCQRDMESAQVRSILESNYPSAHTA